MSLADYAFVYDDNIRMPPNLQTVTGFEWDEGNASKNQRHGVGRAETEQVFLNRPLLLLDDIAHSESEQRFHALGHTDAGRLLHITFTLRKQSTLIRVISARSMHWKERAIYARQQTA